MTKGNVSGLAPSNIAHATTTGQATTWNGTVFVQADGLLTAVGAANHQVLWTAALLGGSTAGSVPAVDPSTGTVFVIVSGASNPVLEGFDVSGARNCTTTQTCSPLILADVGASSGPATPPMVSGGMVFANGASSVAAFDSHGVTGCSTVFGVQVCNPVWSRTTNFSALGVGPALRGGTLYDVVNSGGVKLAAFDAASGNPLWTAAAASPVGSGPSVSDSGDVFLPSGNRINAYPGNGCGAATCAALFSLVQKTGDPAGNFLGGVVFDGSTAYATNADGRVYSWSATGCGSATCQPTLDVLVNTPVGGSTTYSQTPAVTGGMLLLLVQRVVGGVNHVFAVALDDGNGAQLASYDLLAPGFGAGLASASVVDNGVVYAPVDSSLFALEPRPAGGPLATMTSYPLPLSPNFSPSVHDYVVRCAAGTNTLTLALAAVAGGSVNLVQPSATAPSPSQNVTVQLAENQAAVVQASGGGATNVQYWVRCLPHDFPKLFAAPHPEVGAPTPGWYLTGNVVVPPGESSYAMILDTNGTPVWYEKGAAPVSNVTPVGHNFLAFIAEAVSNGFGIDPNVAYRLEHLDTHQVQSVGTVGVPTDIHEFLPLPNGDFVITSYPIKTGVDLTGLQNFGPNSNVADCVVQEVNAQGALVFQWTGSDHIDPVRESLHPNVTTVNGQTVVDPYHCNSVAVDANGNLLISARHMDAVFFVNRATSKITWKLGGTAFSKDGAQLIRIQNDPEGAFSGQHDARFRPNGNIAMFDDHTFGTGSARGVEYALNFTNSTAQPVFQYGQGFNSIATGTFRRDPDGHSVVGWGILAGGQRTHLLTEIDAAGQDVLDINFGSFDAAYRTIKAPLSMFDIGVLRSAVG